MKNARMGNNSRMSNKESKRQSKKGSEVQTTVRPRGDKEVEVLYQKMGDRWFAFSLINDEVFFGSIEQSEIDELESNEVPSKKIAGHS